MDLFAGWIVFGRWFGRGRVGRRGIVAAHLALTTPPLLTHAFPTYSQGGVQFPTGGIPGAATGAAPESPRAPWTVSPWEGPRVKQIWCNARADGNSPDERG
ncbi:hypothetical protein JCM14635_27230 [Megalodesulfovibrio paquesii]